MSKNYARRIAIWSLLFLPIGPTLAFMIGSAPRCLLSPQSVGNMPFAECVSAFGLIGFAGTIIAVLAPALSLTAQWLALGLVTAVPMGVGATALSARLNRWGKPSP